MSKTKTLRMKVNARYILLEGLDLVAVTVREFSEATYSKN